MEWIDRLEAAIGYIEDNLAGEIDTARAAQLAACSVFHFTRMFGYVTGVPLSEYIRRRRLTQAGLELAGGKAKVLDVALKYGYDSPTAFTRAFRALHGVPPTHAKGQGARLVAYPRISFQISIKGEVSMQYRIEEHPGFITVGYRTPTSAADGQNLKDIPQMWSDMTPDKWQALGGIMDANAAAAGFLGICANMREDAFDYYIAVPSGKAVPDGAEALEIPAATWAIFESIGPMPDAIQAVWKRIYSEWMPTSGYTHAGSPDLEVCLKGDTHAADYRCEIWIPVKKA